LQFRLIQPSSTQLVPVARFGRQTILDKRGRLRRLVLVFWEQIQTLLQYPQPDKNKPSALAIFTNQQITGLLGLKIQTTLFAILLR
jgi:hypothetical protein